MKTSGAFGDTRNTALSADPVRIPSVASIRILASSPPASSSKSWTKNGDVRSKARTSQSSLVTSGLYSTA